jgi:hypothetical protein
MTTKHDQYDKFTIAPSRIKGTAGNEKESAVETAMSLSTKK